MSAKPESAAVGERLPYLLAKPQSAARAGAHGADGDTGARGRLAIRVVPRGAARGRGLRPRRLRRPAAHPPRRLPGPQDLGGLRLQRPARRREATDPAPLPARLDHRAQQRLLLRPPGTGKTHLATALSIKAYQAGHRVAVRHRPAMGRPPRARPTPQRAGRRAQAPGALPPARRRRDRPPATGTPGGDRRHRSAPGREWR
jgi:hypothetical protein